MELKERARASLDVAYPRPIGNAVLIDCVSRNRETPTIDC
jgi:hypothetical protein